MIRFKYVPDGLVFINDTYSEEFYGFNKDCIALDIENPLLDEARFLLYTPPRKTKDRERGIEYINAEGNHTTGDDTKNTSMQKIIDNVDSFINASVERQEAARAEAETPRDIIQKEMYKLESRITQRRIREAVLGKDNGWLAKQDELIGIERAKL